MHLNFMYNDENSRLLNKSTEASNKMHRSNDSSKLLKYLGIFLIVLIIGFALATGFSGESPESHKRIVAILLVGIILIALLFRGFRKAYERHSKEYSQARTAHNAHVKKNERTWFRKNVSITSNQSRLYRLMIRIYPDMKDQ